MGAFRTCAKNREGDPKYASETQVAPCYWVACDFVQVTRRGARRHRRAACQPLRIKSGAAPSVSVSDRVYACHDAVSKPNAPHQLVRAEVVDPNFLFHVGHPGLYAVRDRGAHDLGGLAA